jgi:NADH:ubiquinone oxidoreductase subunit 4 (subunit M)
MFPLHIWLPEAHVEAPTIGSVLLAVLLLKLGTYGIIRFSLCLCNQGTMFYKSFIEIFAICAIIYTSLTAIRQIDLKKIIAYSSVGHMNIVLLGLLSLYIESLEGSIFQMLSHGIISGALFFGVGVLYDRYKIRSLKYFGGFATLYPLLASVSLIFYIANISFPGTSSFVGEFLILAGVFHDSITVTFFASISMILGAVYML